MFSESTKGRIGKLYAAFTGWCIVLAVVGLGHGFWVGVIEAGWIPRCVPAGIVDAYCRPSHLIEQIPVLGIPLRLANEIGYRYADRP